MSAVDARCPACGTINKSVDLEETDGWMECESCGEVTQQMKYVTTRRVPRYETVSYTHLDVYKRQVWTC